MVFQDMEGALGEGAVGSDYSNGGTDQTSTTVLVVVLGVGFVCTFTGIWIWVYYRRLRIAEGQGLKGSDHELSNSVASVSRYES
jgi:hypothetical protein